MKTLYIVAPSLGYGPFKIGASKCPEARLIEMQANSPVKLKLLCTTPNDDSLEYRIHAMLLADRSHGEWFFGSDLLDSIIEQMRAGVFDASTIPEGRVPGSARTSNAVGAMGLRARTRAVEAAA